MQQLSRDVWRGMWEAYGEDARLARCSPVLSGVEGLLVTFVGRAVVLGVLTVLRGGHVHLGDVALAPLGWFLKKVGRGRVTITACGLDVIWPRRWYQWLLRRTLPTMDRVVCISRATAEEVRRRGVTEERIVVISPGVWELCHGEPVEPWHMCVALRRAQCDTSPLLLTVGRLVPRKGVAWFVREVVPLLLRDFPRLRYVIVGSGPEELLIKKIVQEQGLGQCVHLRGELDEARCEECFALADLFVAPNIPVAGDMEGFGIVCIEAGLRGVPVVAARLEGLQDAVMDGRTGRFFTPGDAEDCAKVMKEVLGWPANRTFEVAHCVMVSPSNHGTCVSHFDELSVTRLRAGTYSDVQARQAIARATLEHYGWPRLFRRYRDEVFGF